MDQFNSKEFNWINMSKKKLNAQDKFSTDNIVGFAQKDGSIKSISSLKKKSSGSKLLESIVRKCREKNHEK